MIEYEDIRNAMLDALNEHARLRDEEANTTSPGMMAIEPFDAENSDGEPCRAVGVVTNPLQDFIEFVVIKECAGGELIPTTEGSLWRRSGKSAH